MNACPNIQSVLDRHKLNVMISNIVNSAKKINPFGGVFFVINELKKKGIAKLIDYHLGRRKKQAKYSYSDIILNWTYCNLCGAERLDDVEKLRESLGMRLPSHDVLGKVMKSLSTQTDIIKKEKDHQFNIHKPLNNLMVGAALKLGLLKKNKEYTLDYDNTIIETDKYDSTKTYIHSYGYQPGVSFIDKVPVYIEGRNGNSNASYKLTETIKRTMDIMDSNGVKINKFRSDAAASQVKLMRYLDGIKIQFFIRYRKSKDMVGLLRYAPLKWEPMMIGARKYDVTSINSSELERPEHSYRIVVTRYKIDGKFMYRGIITNNSDMLDPDVIYFYNRRGAIERNFDDLKNNFNWGRLPFSFLNENTVFMIISAMGSIIYQYLIMKFSKKLSFVDKKHRLKNFIYHFIMCSAVLVDGRLQVFTDRNYRPLME